MDLIFIALNIDSVSKQLIPEQTTHLERPWPYWNPDIAIVLFRLSWEKTNKTK